MAYLTNGTLNYDLTKDAACCELQLAYIEDRNKMDPTYPDPNDSRFTDPVPVFTILDNLLYRDGVVIGKIYNNKTNKVVEITETTDTEFKYQDTDENAIITKDISTGVVEKLTGLKGEVVNETKLVVYYDIQDISNPTTICTNYDSSIRSIEIDGVLLDSVVTTYLFNNIGEHIIKYEFNNPTTVGNSAPLFMSLTTIKRVVIPNTFTAIGSSAFNACSGLTSIIIPDSVISIGSYAFYNCNSLASIIIPDSVTSIGNNAFNGCTSLTSITIGSGVTSIGQSAFNGTDALKILNYNAQCELSNSFRSSWTNLETVIIGDSTPRIGHNSLQYCSSLISVTIGSGVTSIGNVAFGGCSNLSTITSHIMNAPSVDSGTFDNVKNSGTLYVPIGSSGYETWMNDQHNLGSYGWTKVELS